MSLQVERLNFSFRENKVLDGVSFRADPGNLICVLGRNGAGKSTLFRCILGLLPDYAGRILIDGRDLKSYKTRELAQKIAYIPQSSAAVFGYSVVEMVQMGMTPQLQGMFSVPGKEQQRAAMEALDRLHIGHLAGRSYAQISGGEQQLVLIARAIAQKAKILIMDEPCSSLDYGNQVAVMRQAQSLARQGYLILQSTHSPEHALLFADAALVIKDGKIACFGNPRERLDEELLAGVYGTPVGVYDVSQGMRVCVPLETQPEN